MHSSFWSGSLRYLAISDDGQVAHDLDSTIDAGVEVRCSDDGFDGCTFRVSTNASASIDSRIAQLDKAREAG